MSLRFFMVQSSGSRVVPRGLFVVVEHYTQAKFMVQGLGSRVRRARGSWFMVSVQGVGPQGGTWMVQGAGCRGGTWRPVCSGQAPVGG